MPTYAVVRVFNHSKGHPFIISSEDMFIVNAKSSDVAISKSGWSTDNTPVNYGTTETPIYSRPTYVPPTEIKTTEIQYLGKETSTTIPYILAWGDSYGNPRVVCCYADSFASMLAKICNTHSGHVETFMEDIGMTFTSSNVLQLTAG